jgi:S-adenosylmethionine decarboxylase
MDQVLPALHPNPGWSDSKHLSLNQSIIIAPASADTHADVTKAGVGRHCILELYNCDRQKLNDEGVLRTVIRQAAAEAGATLLALISHQFEPQGVTGLALLAESHMSIHTWPESGYAAVDVFTCGDHTMPQRACDVLRRELTAQSFQLTSLSRCTHAP